MVEARKRRIASSTWDSSAMGLKVSFASDSVMRMRDSSWRIVMGMEERRLAVRSAAATRERMETKCEESFSAAEAESFGAQRLGDVSIGS
jgi:hypothetical protein